MKKPWRGPKPEWSSTRVYTKGKTRHASLGGPILQGRVKAGKPADDGQTYDSSAFAYRSHAQSLGVPGKVRTERMPDTKLPPEFSILGFNGMPLGEVIKQLNKLRIEKPLKASDFHEAHKHIDNFSRLYNPQAEAPKGLLQWQGVEEFRNIKLYQNAKETVWLYFSGNKHFFLRRRGLKLSRSLRYTQKLTEKMKQFPELITWVEHIDVKDDG